MRIGCRLNEQGDAVVQLEDGDGGPLAQIALGETELSDLIEELGHLRSSMADPVNPAPDLGAGMNSHRLSGWTIAPAEAEGVGRGTLLALRDPGLGWIGWFLNEDEAREIGATLRDHAGK